MSEDDAEVGVCDICDQQLIRTTDDCWHPYHVARACPPEHEVQGVTVPEFGRYLRPGREHFRSLAKP